MLFHIKQSHAPKDCPYGKGGSRSLFDGESKDVKIHGYWLAFPQHTTYLVARPTTSRTSSSSWRPGPGSRRARSRPSATGPSHARSARNAVRSRERGSVAQRHSLWLTISPAGIA